MSASRNVSFIKPTEPAFLKAFKAKVGYKEPDGIEAKRPLPSTTPSGPDPDEVEREDEMPTVVVLREGDVGEHEYLENRRHSHMKDDDGAAAAKKACPGVPTASRKPLPGDPQDHDTTGGKITFKKPAKRTSTSADGVLDASSSKRHKTADSAKDTAVVGGATKRRRRSSGGEAKSKQVKNSSLLSFGGEED